MVNLGALLGRHQAFALVTNCCLAADAECLKAVREAGEYKNLDVNWEQFCTQYFGMSRSYADKQIECFEEYGENYRRMAETISISPGTYKLIAGSVSDKSLEFEGEYIPIVRENSARLAAAVKSMRGGSKPKNPAPAVTSDSLDKGLEKLVAAVLSIADQPNRRAEVMLFVERAQGRIETLLRAIREATVIVE
jgi:hypothetical protein